MMREVFSRPALIVFACCAVPRLAALLFGPAAEPTFYSELAHPAGSFPGPFVLHQTMIEPAYPLFLAAAGAVSRDATFALALQIAVACLGGVWLFQLTRTLTADPRAAYAAAIFYALDPFLVRQSVAFMEVSVLATLLIGLAHGFTRLADRRWAVATGILAGLCILTRFSMMPVALFVVGSALWFHPRSGAATAACAVLLAGAWTVHAYVLNGSMLPTRAGVNLYVSLSREAEQLGPTVNHDVLNEHVYAIGNRASPESGLDMVHQQRAQDAALMREALALAGAEPQRAVALKLRNLAHVFTPRLVPYARVPAGARATVTDGRVVLPALQQRAPWEEAVHLVWRTLILVLACAGIYSRGLRREDAALWVTVASFVIVHTVFYPTTRLTSPMVFVWMFFAGTAASRLIRGSSAAALIRR